MSMTSSPFPCPLGLESVRHPLTLSPSPAPRLSQSNLDFPAYHLGASGQLEGIEHLSTGGPRCSSKTCTYLGRYPTMVARHRVQ